MLEVAKLSVKLEFMLLEGALQQGEELAAEQSAQDAHGQKEPIPATHPSLTVGAETSTGDHTVQVRMSEKVL
jgi:hypothetical protein